MLTKLINCGWIYLQNFMENIMDPNINEQIIFEIINVNILCAIMLKVKIETKNIYTL
jgi:hypothetical protein